MVPSSPYEGGLQLHHTFVSVRLAKGQHDTRMKHPSPPQKDTPWSQGLCLQTPVAKTVPGTERNSITIYQMNEGVGTLDGV